MKNITDRLIIFIISIIFVFQVHIIKIDSRFMAAVLLMVDMSLIISLLENKKYIMMIFIIYVFLAIFDRRFIYLSPSIIFSLFFKFDAKYILLLSLFVMFEDVRIIFMVIFSYYLFVQNINLEKLEHRYKRIRDDYTEKNLKLEMERMKILDKSERERHDLVLVERERIAKELHESIGHTISSSIIQIEALKVTTNDEIMKSSLEKVQENLKSGMNEIRSVLHDLKSQSLDLEKKINDLIKSTNRIEGKLSLIGFEDVKMNLKFDIISIVKEAITNSVKHSDADFMDITLVNNRKYVVLNIQDNGKKYVDVSTLEKGIGMISTKEIVDYYAGNMNLSYNNGFNIHILLLENIS